MSKSIRNPPDPYRGRDGGFTYISIVKRLPQILQKTWSLSLSGLCDQETEAGVQRLMQRLTEGNVELEPLHHAPEDDVWRAYFSEMKTRMSEMHEEMTWLNTPWWFAENYFYRRLLDILKYYDEKSVFHLRDPFQEQKEQAITSALESGAVHRMATVTEEYVHTGRESRAEKLSKTRMLVQQLCIAALWGNQADLSFSAGELESKSKGANHDEHILVNDVSAVLDSLFSQVPIEKEHKNDTTQKKKLHQVVYITDNCGLEFLCDMFLCDTLVDMGVVDRVRVLVKDAPTFVSDVMIKDVALHIDSMIQYNDPIVQEYGRRFQAHIDQGRWQITAHPFHTSPSLGWQMPNDLVEKELSDTEERTIKLIVSKGDANYRRLLGDCHWSPCSHDFQEIISQYVSAPLLALRTMKSGCLVLGKDAHARETFDRLNAEENNAEMSWRENGKYGLICFSDSKRVKE